MPLTYTHTHTKPTKTTKNTTGELYTRHFHSAADRARFALFQHHARRGHFGELRAKCLAHDGGEKGVLGPIVKKGAQAVRPEAVAAARGAFEGVRGRLCVCAA